MFGMLESLTKAVVGVVVETPVSIVADAVTLGGLTTDKEGGTYTGDAVGRVLENIKDTVSQR